MKKIILLLFTTIFFVSCSDGNNSKSDNNKESIIDVYENLQNDFNEIRTIDYENLTFSNFQPSFPDINEYYNLELSNDYDKLDMEKIYDMFANQVKKIAPEHDFDEKNIYFSPKDDDEYNCYTNGYPRVIDYKDEFLNGSIETWWLLYESDAEGKTENDVYLWLDHCTFFGVMNKGRGKEVCYPEGFEHINMWEPSEYETINAFYSVNNLPDESHIMADNNSLTVKDAVSLTEDFFTGYLPEEIHSEIKTVVTGVEVREQNNIEGYRLLLANEFSGMPFDYEYDVNYVTSSDDRITQSANAFIADSDNIDYFYNLQSWSDIKKIDNAINTIIPLKTAVQKASETLTENVEFEVRDIKFVYSLKGDTPVTATASWKITTYNPNDQKNYQVYVNAEDGGVSCYTTW